MVRIRSDCLGGLLAATLLWLAPADARALQVFACEPEWAALVRILAPAATLTTATHARQDPHYIEARPALIGALRRADLAVCTGASLETGWLPALQQRASNSALRPGAPGLFFAAAAVELIDRHEQVDRSMGDIHAEGNPHFHLDPVRYRMVAERLAQRLGAIDPASAAGYASRYRQWAAEWDQRIQAWSAKAAPLSGRPVVAQHSGFAYLWLWLGMRQVADLEPKPGLPPTVGHLQAVLGQVRAEPPIAVVQSLYQDPQAGRWLVDRIGVPLLVLPSTVTADGPAADPAGLFDYLIDELLRADAGSHAGPDAGSNSGPRGR